MVGQSLIVFFITFELLLLVLFYRTGNVLAFSIADEITRNDEKVRSLFNLLAINRVKITFAECQVINSIKQVGFACTIVAGENIYTFAKRQPRLCVVLEIDDG